MAGSLTIDNINGKVISSSPVATESQVIGIGQTWQDVTASRALGVTYTNSTGRPISISVSGYQGTGALTCTVSGVLIMSCSSSVASNQWVSEIIPNGATYSITGTIGKWCELR